MPLRGIAYHLPSSGHLLFQSLPYTGPVQSPLCFVAGATGYTGQCLVRLLAQAHTPVVAHIRPDSSKLSAWQERFSSWGAQTDCTPWQPEALQQSLARLAPTHVFALLGTTKARQQMARAARKDPAQETYAVVDCGLTLMLFDAVKELPSLQRFVYLSSLGVRPDTHNSYLAARAKVEKVLLESTVPHLVIRPGLISGPDRPESRPGERAAAVVFDSLLSAAALFGAKKLQQHLSSLDGTTLALGMMKAAFAESQIRTVLEPEHLRALAKA